MRYLTLYVRARRVPAAVAAAAGGTLLMWSVVALFSEVPDADISMVVLLVLLLAASVAPTLGGHDDALERTSALHWLPRRTGHLLVALVVILALVLVTLATSTRFGPAALVLRDATGLLGLTALGAALLGPARSWFLPLGWTLPAVMFPFEGPSVLRQALAWQTQPYDNRSAAVTAGVIAVIGLLAFALKGPALRDARSAA
ncbi:hypothetical protein [Actinoplanes derwentensis]|uniref:Fluoroquinolone transport system permease protein n=1 Tax=Actinoplanes derwentensis TaxID=113562 RepID=A0A1H1ZK26_9ACTN|nr:hypothetical protein [Actinoplanes derwentensis]GID82480.1 hypothetical protein Ade03nite_14040 [Actinoplanes derwentensis]SDT34013.1 hypothetical protein SAMN04489716_3361 [Actinoplanes derwentensis]